MRRFPSPGPKGQFVQPWTAHHHAVFADSGEWELRTTGTESDRIGAMTNGDALASPLSNSKRLTP